MGSEMCIRDRSSIDRKPLVLQYFLSGEAEALLPPPRGLCLDFLSSKMSHKEKSLHKNAILHLPSLLDFSSRFVPDFCPVSEGKSALSPLLLELSSHLPNHPA